MGYYYDVLESDIMVLNERMALVEESIRKYNAAVMKNGYDAEINEDDSRPLIQQIADHNRWGANRIENGFKLSEPWGDTKGDDYCGWLEAIAVGVKDGSYAQVKNEDGAMWRYMFQDGELYKVSPKWIIDADAYRVGSDDEE